MNCVNKQKKIVMHILLAESEWGSFLVWEEGREFSFVWQSFLVESDKKKASSGRELQLKIHDHLS